MGSSTEGIHRSIGDQATGYDDGSMVVDVPATFSSRTVLSGKYRVESVLGRGGMGTVYLATDLIAGSEVALKTLNPELTANDRARARFMQEFRIAQSLGHPSIVRAYSVERHEGTVYYTMERVEGRALREEMAERNSSGGRYELEEVVSLLGKLCEGLAHAHRVTVHRDIKPENILLADTTPKLMDFGIAKALEATEQKTRAASTMGTAYYMAPEQMRGAASVDARADLYSLGILFYELLTGDVPVPGSPPLSEVRRDLPNWVDGFFQKAVAPRDHRFESAAAMRKALTPGEREKLAPDPQPQPIAVVHDLPPPPSEPQKNDPVIATLGADSWSGGPLMGRKRGSTVALTESFLFVRNALQLKEMPQSALWVRMKAESKLPVGRTVRTGEIANIRVLSATMLERSVRRLALLTAFVFFALAVIMFAPSTATLSWTCWVGGLVVLGVAPVLGCVHGIVIELRDGTALLAWGPRKEQDKAAAFVDRFHQKSLQS